VGFKNSVTAVCSPDLNHPPTSVGGISEFSHSLYREVILTSSPPSKSPGHLSNTLTEHRLVEKP
jgi:hypothetical protein